MPNYCANSLTITANTADQRMFLSKLADDTKNLFNSLRPMPDHIYRGNLGVEEREKYGADNWYDWSIANWGTKWDVDVDCVTEDGDKLMMSFDTAWAPPIELYTYLVEQGYSIRATYYEPGMAFAGIYEDGDDRCYEEFDDAFFDSDDGIELDDDYGISAFMEDLNL